MKQRNDLLNAILKSSLILYAILIAICGVFVLRYSKPLAMLLFALALFMVLHLLAEKLTRTKKMAAYFDQLTADMDESSSESIFELAIPMAGILVDGAVQWYNPAFRRLFRCSVFNKNIEELLPAINVAELCRAGKDTDFRILIEDRIYNTHAKLLHQTAAEKTAIVLYMEDVTRLVELEEEYRAERTNIALINIDNYSDAVADLADEERMAVVNQIDRMVVAWVQNMGGIAKKFEADRYFCVMTQAQLDQYCEEKFAILNDLKTVSPTLRIPLTLSIGVGVGGETLLDNDALARAAMAMALGRGGDQVVIRDRDDFRYFGGNSKEVEKRTKVKARVMAHALRELIAKSDNVLIMGHKNADADSLGASIGVACAAMHLGKPAHVILSTHDSTSEALLEQFRRNNYHSGLFVTKPEARELATAQTLLVICDTHRPSLVEYPEMLDAVRTKVLIDHHRRSESFIDDADLIYHEPFASSTSEMVTEILQYFGGVTLGTMDAEVLFAGIVVDTKNFTFKTGVRTFEAAAYLRNTGVDTVKVKRLFQESFADYRVKTDIVSGAELYRDSLAIALVYREVSQTIVAQAADELLEIVGVQASFVVARTAVGINISGRSLGSVNVQLILERLGGGGHMLVAGAQLEGVSIEEAEKLLRAAIDAYFD